MLIYKYEYIWLNLSGNESAINKFFALFSHLQEEYLKYKSSAKTFGLLFKDRMVVGFTTTYAISAYSTNKNPTFKFD